MRAPAVRLTLFVVGISLTVTTTTAIRTATTDIRTRRPSAVVPDWALLLGVGTASTVPRVLAQPRPTVSWAGAGAWAVSKIMVGCRYIAGISLTVVATATGIRAASVLTSCNASISAIVANALLSVVSVIARPTVSWAGGSGA